MAEKFPVLMWLKHLKVFFSKSGLRSTVVMDSTLNYISYRTKQFWHDKLRPDSWSRTSKDNPPSQSIIFIRTKLELIKTIFPLEFYDSQIFLAPDSPMKSLYLGSRRVAPSKVCSSFPVSLRSSLGCFQYWQGTRRCSTGLAGRFSWRSICQNFPSRSLSTGRQRGKSACWFPRWIQTLKIQWRSQIPLNSRAELGSLMACWGLCTQRTST